MRARSIASHVVACALAVLLALPFAGCRAGTVGGDKPAANETR